MNIHPLSVENLIFREVRKKTRKYLLSLEKIFTQFSCHRKDRLFLHKVALKRFSYIIILRMQNLRKNKFTTEIIITYIYSCEISEIVIFTFGNKNCHILVLIPGFNNSLWYIHIPLAPKFSIERWTHECSVAHLPVPNLIAPVIESFKGTLTISKKWCFQKYCSGDKACQFLEYTLTELFRKPGNWRQICKQMISTFYTPNDVSL